MAAWAPFLFTLVGLVLVGSPRGFFLKKNPRQIVCDADIPASEAGRFADRNVGATAKIFL
jgi:hypothetical protein